MLSEFLCVYLRIERIYEIRLHDGFVYKPARIVLVLVRDIVGNVGAQIDFNSGNVT